MEGGDGGLSVGSLGGAVLRWVVDVESCAAELVGAFVPVEGEVGRQVDGEEGLPVEEPSGKVRVGAHNVSTMRGAKFPNLFKKILPSFLRQAFWCQ